MKLKYKYFTNQKMKSGSKISSNVKYQLFSLKPKRHSFACIKLLTFLMSKPSSRVCLKGPISTSRISSFYKTNHQYSTSFISSVNNKTPNYITKKTAGLKHHLQHHPSTSNQLFVRKLCKINSLQMP